MSCQVSGTIDTASLAPGVVGGTSSAANHSELSSSDVVSGWMYLNELGQMCGPYVSEQLLDGLSTGFLPDDLPVYPVMKGTLMVAVPLKLFRQYPDHVATGFKFLAGTTLNGPSISNSQVTVTKDTHTGSSSVMCNSYQQVHSQSSYSSAVTVPDSNLVPGTGVDLQQPLSWDNKCWLYMDAYGRPVGPFSLSDLSYWHHYGHLHSSVMIHHFENQYTPSTLISLINALSTDNSASDAVSGCATAGAVDLLSKISDDIGSQLHDGIMKTARRHVLDEIIGNVMGDFVATKKAQKKMRTEQENKKKLQTDYGAEQKSKTEKGFRAEKQPKPEQGIKALKQTKSEQGINKELKSGQGSKAKKRLKNEQGSKTGSQLKASRGANGSGIYSLDVVEGKSGDEVSNCASLTVVACRSMPTLENSVDKSTEDPCCLSIMNAVGVIDSLQRAKLAVSKKLFDHCNQVLWNAVFYDPVKNCALSWRKDKRWSHDSTEGSVALTENSTKYQTNLEESSPAGDIGSPAHDLDCPPGFATTWNDSPAISASKQFCSSHREDVVSGPRNSICPQHDDYDREVVIARVQTELFLASKISMADFVRTSVEKEALKLLNCWKADQLDKVCEKIPGSVTDLGDTSSDMAQGLHCGDVCLENPLSQGLTLSHEPVLSPCKQISSNFIGSSFKRLGTPTCSAIDVQTYEEPPPPGLIGTMDKSPLFQKRELDRFQFLSGSTRSTHNDSTSLAQCWSSEFLGCAFKKLGMPKSSALDNQSSDEPQPPGSESALKNFVSSGDNKFRRFFLDVSVPKWTKFILLAICRQKLHDDVLRDWKSYLEDALYCYSRNRDQSQEEAVIRSEQMPYLSSGLQPEEGLLTERSKSCHGSGPSDVSVVEFTYSRRRATKKMESKADTLLEFKQSIQSSLKGEGRSTTKLGSTGAVATKKGKPPADLLCSNREELPSRTKVDAPAKRKLMKTGQPVRSSSGQKQQTATGDSLKRRGTSGFSGTASVDVAKYVAEGLAAYRLNCNENKDHSNSVNITKKVNVGANESQQKKLSEKSKLKRKQPMDASSLQSKAPKLLRVDTKQTSCKTLGRGKIQTNNCRLLNSCPMSVGCARCSIDGWEWRKWSLNARPAERARVRGKQITTVQRFGSGLMVSQSSHAKGNSARTNRVKLRNLLAAAEGAEILKASQLKARKKRLRFQRSKIHDWGLIAQESIEAEDFVIEYVGELIRPRISDIRELEYEKMGIGSSYLFRLDDGYVVDATKRGGIARFINHSCEPNCYTKIVTVEGQKRIFIYAKRHIAAGEEITYNYKFPLEEKKIPCNCRSKRCRGSMN